MLTFAREPNSCIHRRLFHADEVHCELLATSLCGESSASGLVSREICIACCQQPQPSRRELNSVVASLILERLSARSASGGRFADADRDLRQAAIDALETSRDGFPTLEPLVDHSVTAEVLAERLERREPFVLMRFGDGEWLSILGISGHNCDGHEFHPDTMGRELRSVLIALAGHTSGQSRVFVGTTCELSEETRPFLARLKTSERIHWVSDAIFRQGMANLATLRFVTVCQQFHGRKVVVGSRHLRPVARALGAHHVVVPLRNCYSEIDAIEHLCRELQPELLLCCASMMSECLIWRLSPTIPQATLVDCGSIFDLMLGRHIRTEYREWSDVVARHYFPVFKPYCLASDHS